MEKDFLRECMEDVKNVPIDEFNKAFCLVCANRDCSRARANTSLFNIRTSNWEKDLFLQVPTLDADNSLARDIISKWYKAPEVTLAKNAPVPDQTAPSLAQEESTQPLATSTAAPVKKPQKSIKKTPKKHLQQSLPANVESHQSLSQDEPAINADPAQVASAIYNPFLPSSPLPEPAGTITSDEVTPLGGTIILD